MLALPFVEKIARADRSLIAWMLYCCVLFNVFACSIGHGQMVGMQLNGISGQFCTVDPRTQAPLPSNSTDENLPTLSKAFGCPLCSTGGMGPALNIAASSGAYALADRGTWLNFKNRADLAVLVEGDKALFNQYGVMVVNPARHPHVKQAAAQAFADWVTSPAGQASIASYKVGGEQLFFPNAPR